MGIRQGPNPSTKEYTTVTTTEPKPQPEDYSDGYGELVRAYRNYLGFSQRTMAEQIGMTERSLSDIEIGRRRCPRGFIDSVQAVVDKFDKAVDVLIETCEGNPGETVVNVNDDPRQEWTRAVVGRAAVDSGIIRPVLVPQYHP
jgi:transcriptional regulator with XRE-family HTH domain